MTPAGKPVGQTLSAEATPGFTLSGSPYLFPRNIRDNEEVRFCESGASKNQWPPSELRRQSDTSLSEQLALSRDKKG